MIHYKTGDIFEAQAEAIVNTVNTVGVMGKGIALQFKQRFPDNYDAYKQICSDGKLDVGQLLITQSNSLFFKYIINFPTKKHWKQPSQYQYIEDGLAQLVEKIRELNIKSVAMPPLGAGNGKLDWEKVKPIIEKYLTELPNVAFYIYEPQKVFEERDNKKTKNAKLTPIRAMFVYAFHEYERADSSLNLLVAQKLAYFLQRLGEPLRLEYSKGWYGPYATNLNKVLQVINGTYISYESQKDSPITRIQTVEERLPEIKEALVKLSEVQKFRLNKLLEFIDGFQTPFSLELLATVDWILKDNPNLSPDEVYQQIGQWTKRKAELIKPHHVNVAYSHLKAYKGQFN